MKKLALLCREPRLYSCQRLKQAAEKVGYSMDILDPNRFLLKLDQGQFFLYYQFENGEIQELSEYQGVIGRFGTTSTTIGCQILRHFEQLSIPCLNSANAFELARDKWRSLQQLALQNLPVPTTMISGNLVSTLPYLQLDLPIVLKTVSGAQGEGVMLAENFYALQGMTETLRLARIPFIQQSFISEAKGQDIRIFVVGTEIVAAMQRNSKENDFRANIHQGGTASPITLTDIEKELAIKATKSMQLDVAGVDLIRSRKGALILEVNASPGLEMIEKVSGVDIAEKMIFLLSEKIGKLARPSLL